MGEGKRGIATDRIDEALGRFIQKRRISGGTQTVAAREFRISQRVFTVAWPGPEYLWTQRPAQCTRDLSGDLVLNIKQALDTEITFPCKASVLQMRVKHFYREPGLPFCYPNGTLHDEANS